MGAYQRPASLEEAISTISAGDWTVLAGGTDFYPARVGKPVRENILDISAISGLRGIREEANGWFIGATTTWSDIARSDLPSCFDALKQAAREVGGVQIQNTGTVCGNICNASPAADGVPPLMALDAEVVVVGASGSEMVPLGQFILGNRRTARRPDQIVTGLHIPVVSSRGRSAFFKLGARRYLVISIAMAACVLDADEAGAITRAAVSVGACSEVARRLPELEADLVGKMVSPDLAGIVEPRHAAGLAPIDDVRGSAEYRSEAAVEVLRLMFGRLGSSN